MSNYKPVHRILSQGGEGLQPLLDRARYLQSLTRRLHEHLDSTLADHIRVANLRDHTAVICADSPAWLARVRYLAPQILQILRAQAGLESLQKIQFKILPPDSLSDAQPMRFARLSADSARVIHSAADSIGHADLAAALARLSRRQSTPEDPD